VISGANLRDFRGNLNVISGANLRDFRGKNKLYPQDKRLIYIKNFCFTKIGNTITLLLTLITLGFAACG
jgi:hypothetical protein